MVSVNPAYEQVMHGTCAGVNEELLIALFALPTPSQRSSATGVPYTGGQSS
jgi:hypothetical protein